MKAVLALSLVLLCLLPTHARAAEVDITALHALPDDLRQDGL